MRLGEYGPEVRKLAAGDLFVSPQPGWLGRAYDCEVWLVKEAVVAKFWKWCPPGLVKASGHACFGNGVIWYCDEDGRGYDGSQILLPMADDLTKLVYEVEDCSHSSNGQSGGL